MHEGRRIWHPGSFATHPAIRAEVSSRVTQYERRLRKRLGMNGVRLHDLWHRAASAALNAGVPMLKVSRMVGHSRISTTVDVYGHSTTSPRPRTR